MSTELAVRWRVRLGRSCRFCGEMILAKMATDRSKIDGHHTICKLCDRLRRRAYHAVNQEAENERCRAYHAANQEAANERHRTRRAVYAARSDEEIAAAQRRMWPGEVKPCRRCREEKPLAAFYVNKTESDGLQRVCKRCNGENLKRIAEPLWLEVGIDSARCLYCPKPSTDVEHVFSRNRGGTDAAINLVPACADCNRGPGGKWTMLVHDWLRTRKLVPFSEGLTVVLGLARFSEYLASGRGIIKTADAVAA